MNQPKKDVNPFIVTSHIKVMTNASHNESKQENEKFTYSGTYVMDLDKAVKIYNVEKFEEIVYMLTPRGAKLFFYIIFHLGKKKDQIELSEKKVSELTSMSSSSFTKARAELKKNDIITKVRRGRKNMYWVNPIYIFSGNRPRFIKETYGEEYIWDKNKHPSIIKDLDEDEF